MSNSPSSDAVRQECEAKLDVLDAMVCDKLQDHVNLALRSIIDCSMGNGTANSSYEDLNGRRKVLALAESRAVFGPEDRGSLLLEMWAGFRETLICHLQEITVCRFHATACSMVEATSAHCAQYRRAVATYMCGLESYKKYVHKCLDAGDDDEAQDYANKLVAKVTTDIEIMLIPDITYSSS